MMEESEDIKIKLSEEFGVDILKLSDYLQERKCNLAIITQIVKSGTSIGALIAESKFAESKDDFIHKLKISLKEASETNYWLKILNRSGYLDQSYYSFLMDKCSTLIKVLISIINKTSSNF